jgi:hypothetical protein
MNGSRGSQHCEGYGSAIGRTFSAVTLIRLSLKLQQLAKLVQALLRRPGRFSRTAARPLVTCLLKNDINVRSCGNGHDRVLG